MLELGTVLNNRYEIESAPAATLYRALDRNLGGRTVLVKALAGDIERLRDEAYRLAALDPAHLIPVADFFEHNGHAFVVVGSVEGRTLGAIAKKRPVSLAEAVTWTDQIGEALEHLHSQQPPIVFGQAGPQSAALDDQGQVRLVPFGIARALDTDTPDSAGAHFTAAELLAGGSVDVRADVYSLGATLYSLVTGQSPPLAMDLLTGDAELVNPTALNPGLPPALEAIVLKAMAPRKEERHGSVREVRADLRRLPVEAPGPFTGFSLPALIEPRTAGSFLHTPVRVAPAAPSAAPAPHPPRERPTATPFRSLPQGPLDKPRSRAASASVLLIVFPTLVALGLGSAWWMGRDSKAATPAVSASTAASTAPSTAPTTAAATPPANPAAANSGAPSSAARVTALLITSEPSGAHVSIDGQAVSDVNGLVTTPAEIDVKPGRHEVQVEKSGFETFHTTVPRILEGQKRRIQAELHVKAPAPPPPAPSPTRAPASPAAAPAPQATVSAMPPPIEITPPRPQELPPQPVDQPTRTPSPPFTTDDKAGGRPPGF